MCHKASVVPAPTSFPPQKLTEEEIKDPFLVIHDLFDFDHLSGIRELLWEFFKTTIIGNYTHGLSRRDRSLLITLYERIEKLVEAAHIIHVTRNSKTKPVFETYPFLPENIHIANLEKLAGKAEGISAEQLKAVVESIVQATNAEKVFLASIGKDAANLVQYDFLILLPGNAQYTYKAYQTQNESKCSEFGSVLVWYSKIAEVYKLLKEGHVFYSGLCTPNRLVYDNGRLPLPETPNLDIPAIKVKARNIFNELFELAKSFLDGGEYYATTEQRKTAAFLLHQATEHALRALLFSLTAYNAYGHNLQSLLRHCSYCAPELSTIFPQNTDKEKEIFRLLNTAYVHVRYKTSYEISQDDVMLLLDRVNTLQTEIQQFFEEKLIAFENLFAPIN